MHTFHHISTEFIFVILLFIFAVIGLGVFAFQSSRNRRQELLMWERGQRMPSRDLGNLPFAPSSDTGYRTGFYQPQRAYEPAPDPVYSQTRPVSGYPSGSAVGSSGGGMTAGEGLLVGALGGAVLGEALSSHDREVIVEEPAYQAPYEPSRDDGGMSWGSDDSGSSSSDDGGGLSWGSDD